MTPIQFVEDTPESYDDVITPENNIKDIKGVVTCFIIILKAFSNIVPIKWYSVPIKCNFLFCLYVRVHVVDTADQYDDVIINGQDSQGVTGESHRTRSCLQY